VGRDGIVPGKAALEMHLKEKAAWQGSTALAAASSETVCTWTTLDTDLRLADD